MREKTCNKLFDHLFWYTLYMLPILLMLLNWFRGGSLSLSDSISTAGVQLLTTNPIFDVLMQTFGTNGYLPTFVNNDVIMYLSYFIMLIIIHVFVDVLAFIPRFCHNLIHKGENYGKF